jgi:hypothetical protein
MFKNKVTQLTICALMVLFSAPLAACSSSAQQEKITTTTIDPQILELQEKVKTLESTLATTTTSTTTTTKPSVYITDVMRFFSGYTKFDQHECREIFKYSDGTEFESPRRWVPTTKDWRGVKEYNC